MLNRSRACLCRMACLILLPSGAGAAQALTVDGLEALSLRSPNVFDTFFRTQRVQEQRMPTLFFEGGAVVGPAYTIQVDGVGTEAHVAGGDISFAGVPWMWDDRAGIRAGFDIHSTNLTPKGSPMEDGWGYRTALVYASAFDLSAGWSGSLGVFLRMRPVTRMMANHRVFSSKDPRWGSAETVRRTTETESVQGFLHGTIPWVGVTTGFLFDDGGLSRLKGRMDAFRAPAWESFGPVFGSIPEFGNYQLGIQASGIRAWSAPVSLSAEATGRREDGLGTGFDHALLRVELVLFEDAPGGERDRKAPGYKPDFRLRIGVHGSCHNRPEIPNPWGWGFMVDALSLASGQTDIHVGLGGGFNYYGDMVVLPVANETTFRFRIGVEM